MGRGTERPKPFAPGLTHRGPIDAEPLDLIEICAELAKEFKITSQTEIEELDRWYIAFVLFARRDKWGTLIVRSKPRETPRLGEREAWMQRMTVTFGYPTWYAEREWEIRQAVAPKAAKAKPAPPSSDDVRRATGKKPKKRK